MTFLRPLLLVGLEISSDPVGKGLQEHPANRMQMCSLVPSPTCKPFPAASPPLGNVKKSEMWFVEAAKLAKNRREECDFFFSPSLHGGQEIPELPIAAGCCRRVQGDVQSCREASGRG